MVKKATLKKALKAQEVVGSREVEMENKKLLESIMEKLKGQPRSKLLSVLRLLEGQDDVEEEACFPRGVMTFGGRSTCWVPNYVAAICVCKVTGIMEGVLKSRASTDLIRQLFYFGAHADEDTALPEKCMAISKFLSWYADQYNTAGCPLATVTEQNVGNIVWQWDIGHFKLVSSSNDTKSYDSVSMIKAGVQKRLPYGIVVQAEHVGHQYFITSNWSVQAAALQTPEGSIKFTDLFREQQQDNTAMQTVSPAKRKGRGLTRAASSFDVEGFQRQVVEKLGDWPGASTAAPSASASGCKGEAAAAAAQGAPAVGAAAAGQTPPPPPPDGDGAEGDAAPPPS